MERLYNIPAGIPFSKSLAAELLREHESAPESLADILILLPTRRACRTLREAFLQLNNGKPILLPRMQPLGDIDEEELSLSMAGKSATAELLNLPPAMPPIRRQILLARAILARPDFKNSFDHALALAKALGALMDQIYTEGLDMKDLAALAPEEFAEHWQITLDFLNVLSEEWPKILGSLGVIDTADRRTRLIEALSTFWQNHPPQNRIIAAGTTGSIPATAKLLGVIAGLPNAQIVLPGLDEHIDEDSWNAISENHPQFGFKHLFETIGIERKNIKQWPDAVQNPLSGHRRALISHVMRPAETTQEWQSLANDTAALAPALEKLKLYTCDTQSEEALTIAALMRGILESPEKTAVLITPDRILARRVSTLLERWNITIDDSAGTPLSQSAAGLFLTLTANACKNDIAPVSLLALIKHPLCIKSPHTQKFEERLLRGTKPPAGFDGLYTRLEEIEKADNLKPYIQDLETAFAPLYALFQSEERISFSKCLRAHIQTCENLAKKTEDNSDLWAGEDGQNLAAFLSDLLNHAALFPDIAPTEYPEILQQFLTAQTTRPAYGTHPRLQILGQLEARLIDADLVILGGLNEGSWPPDAGHDPWMSRPMRKNFGLPAAERSIGLAAHDFVQGFCAPNVALTRSVKIDGAPTVPARWLARLHTVIEAAGLPPESLLDPDLPHWLKSLDAANEDTASCTRPAPTPPLTARPTRVSVTKIETWLKDPYSLYAYYVLNLRKLDPPEKQTDAAMRGDILHKTLENFITAYPKDVPENAANIIQDIALKQLEDNHIPAEEWEFYRSRFETITDTFLQKEHEWRENAAPLACEAKGEIDLDGFILHGYADRIDTLDNGAAAIIDYKSGGQFSKIGMENGNNPQLPLEALILQHGGFETIPATTCGYLGYWTLNAAGNYTEITEPDDILVDTKDALQTLIKTFQNPETPYYSLPRAAALPRFNDYEHLARVKEWSAMDEAGEDAA